MSVEGSSFFERIDQLRQAVGHGTITAKVEVDQVYAHYIHEGISHTGRPLVMHEGGRDHYLRDPLFENADRFMDQAAARLVTPDGSEIREAMKDIAEDLSQAVFDNAPREFGDLRASGHPSVIDDGETVYDRPPNVHRLSEEELKHKHEIRRLFPVKRRPHS